MPVSLSLTPFGLYSFSLNPIHLHPFSTPSQAGSAAPEN